MTRLAHDGQMEKHNFANKPPTEAPRRHFPHGDNTIANLKLITTKPRETQLQFKDSPVQKLGIRKGPV